MNLEAIRKHWESAGAAFDPDSAVTPTSRDPYLGELERNGVLAHLSSENRVMEVGCGDGSHTTHFALAVDRIVGVDIADSLLEIARRRALDAGIQNADFVRSSVLDIDSLPESQSIDTVVCQRCLINLPTWDYQKQALETIADILPPGGRLILTEGFQDELDNLNAVRESVGLTAIRVVDYNRNFQHTEFDPYIVEHFEVERETGYGFYMFLSRVFHPLFVQPDQPTHDGPLNGLAGQLSAFVSPADLDRYSYNRLYILRRK